MNYGLLGLHLSHSDSPAVHRALGRADYRLYEVEEEGLALFLKKGDFEGLNVTLPYKQKVIPYCRELTREAKITGAVNTIFREADGHLVGHNTDAFGFSYLLQKKGIDVSGARVTVFGRGGAASAVRASLFARGAGEVLTVSRSSIPSVRDVDTYRGADIIVNATPVGMAPGPMESVTDLSIFPNLTAVVDLVANPSRTQLLTDAEAMGIPCVGGFGMLVAQAWASELFWGMDIPRSAIDETETALKKELSNIVLIGMPGCGKTSVGMRISSLTGRAFYDTDRILHDRIGDFGSYLNRFGEEAFRKAESEVVRDLASVRGAVIATGGGVVCSEENLPDLRRNGTIVFLDRPISELPIDGRPLSARYGTEQLAKERLPLYRAWSDVTAAVGADTTESAHNVLAAV